MQKIYLGIIAGAVDVRVVKAARGIIDFIYYARMQHHTEATLKKLDKAWEAWHENKEIFIQLGIREEFNIPKLHSMHHYLMAVMSHGTLDGYNSESPERLHIDFAKAGYNASNKKDYIPQMTVWLKRREAVHRFTAYLAWLEGVERDEGDDGENSDEEESGDHEEEELAEETKSSYHLAKTPGYGHLSVADIIAEFHAVDFLSLLKQFLLEQEMDCTRFHAISTTFAVYKRVTLQLPKLREVSDLTDLSDPIRTRKFEPATGKDRKKAIDAQFDTALASKNPLKSKRSLNGKYLCANTHFEAHQFTGTTVCQVRVIFRLPEEYGQYDTPLAYVEWFTPLDIVQEELGMYKVHRATHQRRRKASIIPVTQILRSCHLIPDFATKISRAWSSKTVLDEAKEFYLNPYLRMHDFVLFRVVEDM
jgi:hypothetical protein